MQAILIYVCKVIICSGLLFGYYLLALKNKKFHSYNRFYLLASVVISFIAPLLHFEWYMVKAPQSTSTVKMLQVVSSSRGEQEFAGRAVSQFDIWNVASVLYVLTAITLLLLLITRIIWIYKLQSKGKVIKCDGFQIIQTDTAKAPFSFFNKLFWKQTIDIESETGQQILKHELTHIRQRHTLDKLFMQGVLIVLWANPVYWLMQKELSMIHEFIADGEAVQEADTEAFARMLLQSHYGNILPDIVQSFFYSPIKRRLIMLTETKKVRYTKLRKLFMLPMIITPLALFSFTLKNNEVVRPDQQTVLILDAAHGGRDNGATHGSIKEKNLTMMIVDRMAELAPEYNIKVIKTRTGDEYPTLEERVQKANDMNADMFISIHVNSGDYRTRTNDYELIISKTNEKYSDCKALASILGAKLNDKDTRLELTEKNLWVLKNNVHPAVAIECGYIDDAHNLRTMSSKTGLDKLCRNILSGVAIFKVNKTHMSDLQSADSAWRIQSPAYENEEK